MQSIYILIKLHANHSFCFEHKQKIPKLDYNVLLSPSQATLIQCTHTPTHLLTMTMIHSWKKQLHSAYDSVLAYWNRVISESPYLFVE